MDLTPGLRRVPAADPADVGEDEALAARIRAEIEADGPMTFARFMELALYDPDGGYYRSAEARPGRSGDFLTAPELHPIFGETLANQLTEIWERLERPDPFVVEEHGAGTGALAEAVLRGLARTGSPVLESIRYVPLEIDQRRIETFEDRLAAAGFADRIAPPGSVGTFTGVVVANEVLDALPVHRVAVRDGRLLERFVGVDAGGAFTDVWGEPSTVAIARRLADEGVALAEGQSAEVCLAVDGWLTSAVAPLGRGLLLLVDYGADAGDLYDPIRRPHGTVRAFARHRLHDDLYAHVGRQDVTAHVDLTAADAAARSAGLTVLGRTTQAGFLMGNGIEGRLREVQADPATTLEDYAALRSALVRLIDPAGMGGFHVLAYGRAWPDGPPLAGFAYRAPSR
jgi:SAM-dependent MidA family methyltransferase